MQGHDNWVRSLAFATYTGTQQNETTATNHTLKQGDLMLASASQDRYIRLWKVSPHTPSPKPVASPQEKKNNDEITDDLLQALQESALYVSFFLSFYKKID